MVSVGPPLLLPLYFHYEVIYFCIKRRDYLVRIWDWRCHEELPFIGVAASLAHQLLLVFKCGGTKDSNAGPVQNRTSWRVCEGLQTLHKHWSAKHTLPTQFLSLYAVVSLYGQVQRWYKSLVCDCEWMKHKVLLINFVFYVSNFKYFQFYKMLIFVFVVVFTIHVFLYLFVYI